MKACKKRIFLSCRLLVLCPAVTILSCSLLRAQPFTKISGKVTDLLTNEAIPFANVAFKNSGTGTVTDMDGNYNLATGSPGDSLTASFVGYDPVSMPVVKGKSQQINFSLRHSRLELPEVVVVAGENPADILIRKVIENKDEKNRENLDAYQYELYNKLEFDISNITPDLKRKKLLKQIAFVFDNIDTSATNKKPFLPVFVSEAISDVYYRRDQNLKKEIIRATRVSGIENGAINQFLGDMYQNINIYDNYIMIFKKAFVSPVSTVGPLFYKYYLTDSLTIDGQWCYKLKFKPRRKHELTFTGNMWIHDTSFAIRRAEMRVSKDANINFVEELAIVQEFRYVNREAWMKTRDVFVVDFVAREGDMGFIGRKTASYKDFIFHQPKDEQFFMEGEKVEIEPDAEKPVEFWNIARHDSLSENEKRVYQMVDTIKNLPVYRTALDLVTMIATGYKPFGKIEIGPYMKLFSYNSFEGQRFRFGCRTSNRFSEDLVLGGYLAYGAGDRRFKYGGDILYFLSKKPRQSAGISFRKDVEEFGLSQNDFRGYRVVGRGNENVFQNDNLFSSIFRRVTTNKFTRVREGMVFYEREWKRGLSNKLSFVHRLFIPLGNLDYRYYKDVNRRQAESTLTTSEISLHTRYAHNEKFISGKRTRLSLGSSWPIVRINYTLGLKDFSRSDFSYHKLSLKIDDRVELKPFGFMLYILTAGKTWGTLPFPLLEVHRGNETYNYSHSGFNMMSFYEFISDRYAGVSLSHHFEGLFFDRIPLLRKLHWREVINGRVVIGSLEQANRDILVNGNVRSLAGKPYAEAGVAIENIFRFIRIDAIWRLTHLDNVVPGAAKINSFGIMGSMQLTF